MSFSQTRSPMVFVLLAATRAAQNTTDDYVIAAAAATAEPLLAVVLSEHPDISVIVLENGGDARHIFQNI
ncbi:hypothetical protein TruAng_010945 [Truncatella angustata]|nr:hypothetical protein TruAng_010945 [Truncatella angustata]